MGSIGEPVTLEYLCKLNDFIARSEALEWGRLRTGSAALRHGLHAACAAGSGCPGRAGPILLLILRPQKGR